MVSLDKKWIARPPDRELSIGLVLLGSLVTVIAFFFAFIFGMAYRNSPVQDWAYLYMAFAPPVFYLAMMAVTVSLIRRNKRSWPASLVSCLGPVGLWFLGLAVMSLDYALQR